MTRSGFLSRAALGAALVLVAAEGALVLAEGALPAPVEWYNVTAHAKALQMERRARARMATDVVFVGPSTVFRGIHADLFEREDPRGRSAYNAGVNGGYPPVMRRWVTEEVVPRLRPRTVVYGLSSLDFHDRIFRGSVDAYRTARATRKGLLAAGERLVARLSRLIKYRQLLQDPEEYPYVRRALTGATEGRVERQVQALSPTGFRAKQPISRRERLATDRAILRGFDVGGRGTRHVEATVEHLRARGIEVVFVNMPVPDRFVALHPNGAADYRRFERHLARLARALHVELLQPPRSLKRGGLYADNVHLNERGAQRFTRWLAATLADR